MIFPQKSFNQSHQHIDGAGSQFKQRCLFPNLHEWENEFSVSLIWNFFATSHRKGAADGIGGTVERSVWRSTRASSTFPCDAKSYAEIATQRNPNINVLYIVSNYNHQITIIFWEFLMLYQIFLLPQVKRCAIITYKHGISQLPHELPNNLRILGN